METVSIYGTMWIKFIQIAKKNTNSSHYTEVGAQTHNMHKMMLISDEQRTIEWMCKKQTNLRGCIMNINMI